MLNIDELASDYVPTTCASDVEITMDDCSENSYFPKHKCSFITGYSDAGKNYFSCGVVASISRDIAIPGEVQRDVGDVLILSTEWDLDDLKYRLLKCNADMDHIHIVDYYGKPAQPLLSKDLAEVKSTKLFASSKTASSAPFCASVRRSLISFIISKRRLSLLLCA